MHVEVNADVNVEVHVDVNVEAIEAEMNAEIC